MVEPLRHRQTKGAATAMFYPTPPRHISTLPICSHRRTPCPCLLLPRKQTSAGAACTHREDVLRRALRQIRFMVLSPTTRRSILLIRSERSTSAALIAAIVSRNVLTFDPSDTIPPITTAIDPMAVT